MKTKIIPFIFIFIFLLLFNALYAQDERIDSLTFDSSPLAEERPTYFGLGGGYTGNFFFINFNDLNKHLLDNNFGLDELKAPVYVSGGGGFIGNPYIKNMRIGFFSMGGTKSVEKTELVNSQNTKKQFDFSLGYTGLAVDYGYVVFKNLAVLPGISLGWGSVSLQSSQSVGDIPWNGFNSEADTINFLKVAKSNFLFIQPNLYVEYTIRQFFVIRLNIGYSQTFMGDWKYNINTDLKDVPKGINGNGFYFGFGVFLGLFNY